MKRENLYYIPITLLSAAVIILALILIYILRHENYRKITVEFKNPEYKVFAPEIPTRIDFCGEPAPMNIEDVYERVEREILINVHWNSSTLLNLKRANRWFPVIEPILRKHGVPDDFKYMAVIESNLTNAVSPAGAAGFWQLTEPAAIKYGLEISKAVDERYDVEKATEAACKYIKDSFAKYKSWTMAAASYNYGTNGIDRQIDRQKEDNYYELYLNEETFRFVARILAIKEIMTHPAKYGYFVEREELYKPYRYKTVNVRHGIKDLADFAKRHGSSYKELKLLNPWLRDNYLPSRKGKIYSIKIPDK
ncbi:lytic transglycosylase domain-containing protein [Melioribacter sp. Ez-97]|uniref:lytic transglycosylase domain-containing protein n=1 Tax=Melioribacter sp. Ez-97 TaxID=3423434 RepID=UPI003ED9B013